MLGGVEELLRDSCCRAESRAEGAVGPINDGAAIDAVVDEDLILLDAIAEGFYLLRCSERLIDAVEEEGNFTRLNQAIRSGAVDRDV